MPPAEDPDMNNIILFTTDGEEDKKLMKLVDEYDKQLGINTANPVPAPVEQQNTPPKSADCNVENNPTQPQNQIVQNETSVTNVNQRLNRQMPISDVSCYSNKLLEKETYILDLLIMMFNLIPYKRYVRKL